jgi:hypothetical protein
MEQREGEFRVKNTTRWGPLIVLLCCAYSKTRNGRHFQDERAFRVGPHPPKSSKSFKLTLVMTVWPPCSLTKSWTLPNGALSNELPPLRTRNGQLEMLRQGLCLVHTDKVGDSLVVWRAHLRDTRNTVLWDSVLVGCNDRGGGAGCVVFGWRRSDGVRRRVDRAV